MFNQRQLEILIELCENVGNYMSASYFATKHTCSLRTVQNDMKLIRENFPDKTCAKMESVVPKGTRIQVLDSDSFMEMRSALYQQFSNTTVSSQDERVSQLLLLLLQQKRALSMYDLETTIFVSRNTLFADLKIAEELLQKYDLELMRSSSKVMIDGSEVNKRRCIYEKNLMLGRISESLPSTSSNEADMKKLKDILVKILVSRQQSVSEANLNNTIVMLYVTLRRLENFFMIQDNELDITEDTSDFLELSEDIFKEIGRTYMIRIPQAEIDYFALYLKGTGNASTTSVISEEINEYVLNGLRAIRSACGIDLTDDVNLRISLGLHLSTLIVRLKYNMQLENHLVSYIRQTYPQGYDIATYFAHYLQDSIGKRIKDEEIAFLAIHLYNSLMELQNRTGTRKVLIISDLRRSENILLRQTIYNWFDEQIAELYMVQTKDMDERYLDRYDTFITTEKGMYYSMGLALYINPFPNRQDYLNIKLAMDGFESVDDIVDIFREDFFFNLNSNNKEDALSLICSKCSETLSIPDLYDSVQRREDMRSTFFGNKIAAAHPHTSVSPDTFIAVGVSPDPITWDEDGNRVNILLLVHIGKNNPKAFQLWNYLSKMIAYEKFAEQLLSNPSYNNFLYLLKDTISRNNE